MLMRLERGAILRTHYQMGLRRTKSSPLHAWVCPQSTHPLPTPSPGKATGSTLPPRQTKLWSEKVILTRGGRLTSAQQGGEKIHPRGMWSFPFPCKSGRRGTTPRYQLSRIPTSEPNRENNEAMQAVFGLHVMPGRSRTNLSSKRHGSRNPQQHVVPLQAQIPQPSRRPHVHGGKRRNPHQQRGSPQHLSNNPGRHVIRSGGRTGRPIHQCKNSRFNATNAHRTRSPAAPHPDANQ